MTASADVSSANIVGYQNVKVPYNKSLVTATFKNVSGEKLDLKQITPLNDLGQMFAKGPTTQCAGKITVQKLTSSTGKYADTYAYYWPTNSGKYGWCTTSGRPIDDNEVLLEDGEAVLVANTWKSNTDVYFQCSGEVDLLGENAVPYNKSLSGNALPRTIDLTEIVVLNNDKQMFAKGPTTQCAGKVTVQKLTSSTGKYAETYAYYWPTNSGKYGWCTTAGKPIAVGDVTIEPGEALLVANTWKSNTLVYFDLPDPLKPMPEPEVKPAE